ncbi:MAG: hypothetical protein KAY37_02850 [Phycisphaerae bacterium]|nr:hypothetical protein [Phycisphaerae bacterium]
MGKTKGRTARNASTSRVWSRLWRALKAGDPVAIVGLIITVVGLIIAVVGLIITLMALWFDANRRITELTGENSVLQIENKQSTDKISVLQIKNTELTDEISALQLENIRLRAELNKCDEARTILERAARPDSSEPLPPRVGKAVPASVRRFPVDIRYVASGKMGDIGDVTFGGGKFTYKTVGQGPHEWKFKYVDNELNPRPAQFGGVVWLSPQSEFGTFSDGGYDLRGFRGIEWEAKATGDPVKVEFFIGGINRVGSKGEDGRFEFVRAPYPDTMPRTGLGIRKLTNEWQTFRVSLADQPEGNFARVVGGFGWIATWGNNGVEPDESGMGPNNVKKFTFEVRNVFYVKEIE